jgi:hypothetical protein
VAQPTTLAEERVEQIRANPEGHRYAVDNAWLTGTPDEVAPRLVKAFTTLPSEKAFSLWFDFAHAPKPADMALSLQTTIYFASYVVWEDEKDDERCRAWLDERVLPGRLGLHPASGAVPLRRGLRAARAHPRRT